jgi:diacylglycerol kinase family enzyme
MAGVGFEGSIARKFEDGGKRGIGPYIKMVPKSIIKYKPKEYNICVDGNEISRQAYTVSVANTTQHGGGAHICPLAKPDDGIINVVILKPFKYIWMPGLAYKLFTRNIHKSRAIEVHDGKQIVIKGQNLCAHIDGEPIELGDELVFEVKPRSISVIC